MNIREHADPVARLRELIGIIFSQDYRVTDYAVWVDKYRDINWFDHLEDVYKDILYESIINIV